MADRGAPLPAAPGSSPAASAGTGTGPRWDAGDPANESASDAEGDGPSVADDTTAANNQDRK